MLKFAIRFTHTNLTRLRTISLERLNLATIAPRGTNVYPEGHVILVGHACREFEAQDYLDFDLRHVEVVTFDWPHTKSVKSPKIEMAITFLFLRVVTIP